MPETLFVSVLQNEIPYTRILFYHNGNRHTIFSETNDFCLNEYSQKEEIANLLVERGFAGIEEIEPQDIEIVPLEELNARNQNK